MADDDAAAQGEAGGLSAVQAAVRAREQIVALTGHPAQTVSSVQFDGDRWHVTVELLELERIPASTDVLGTYTGVLDGDGALVEYRRVERYLRSQSSGSEAP